MQAEFVLQLGSWVASGLLTVGLFAMRALFRRMESIQQQLNKVHGEYVTESRVRELVHDASAYRDDKKLIDRRLEQHEREIDQLKSGLSQIRDGQNQISGAIKELRAELRSWHEDGGEKV